MLSKNLLNPPNPLKYSGFTLWQKANHFEKEINQALKPFELNQSELFHLISIKWLTHTGENITQTELAKFSKVTTMSVSKILRKLESKKLIKRNEGEDSRSKCIQVTKLGMKILLETCDILYKINNKLK